MPFRDFPYRQESGRVIERLEDDMNGVDPGESSSCHFRLTSSVEVWIGGSARLPGWRWPGPGPYSLRVGTTDTGGVDLTRHPPNRTASGHV